MKNFGWLGNIDIGKGELNKGPSLKFRDAIWCNFRVFTTLNT